VRGGDYAILAAILLGIPLAIAALFSWAVQRTDTPEVFACRRCGQNFSTSPRQRLPKRCTRCRATTWNQ